MSYSSRLKLSVINRNDLSKQIHCKSNSFSLDHEITIGRSKENHIILPDPSRIISRVQARVSWCDDSSAKVENVSSSASFFINTNELKPGCSAILCCPDSLIIGTYMLKLEMCNSTDEEDESLWGVVQPNNIKNSIIPDEVDFLSNHDFPKINKNLSFSDENLLSDGYEKKEFLTGLINSAYRGMSELKNDKDSIIDGVTQCDNFVAAESSPDPFLSAAPKISFTQSYGQSPSGSNSSDILKKPHKNEDTLKAAFAKGLNITPQDVPDFSPAFFEHLGEILHHLTAGTVNMMHERAKIKHEMRADVTIIATTGNNPLKFAPDTQSAITHLLNKTLPGFMPSRDAINDAFDDLHAHQVGLLSGARESIYGVVKIFSPEKIKSYLASNNIIESFFPASKKSKLWELYEAHYSEVAGSAQEEFEMHFQQAFAQAYEQVIDKVCKAR